jgi:phosphoserine phosphatase RsbU/P
MTGWWRPFLSLLAVRWSVRSGYNAVLRPVLLGVSWLGPSVPTMNIFSRPLTFLPLATGLVAQSTSELRWQLTAIAIGAVILSFGLAGLLLFLFRPKTGDRSLAFFSLFAILYAVRLMFRQSFLDSLVPAPADLWKYSDLVIDNFIVVPLTLFLIEIVETRWKSVLRWVLAFQIAFGTARFLSNFLNVGQHRVEIAYHLVVVAYCLILLVYPFSLARGQPREFKVVFAGLAVFGLFAVHTNLVDLGVIRGRNVEPIGFLVFVCCLGYLAAFRTYSNEQRLLSIQKELEIARQIQCSILPREVPRVAGLDIAARYVPTAAVAGDFYDFIVVDESRVGILVADVTGHGVPAALIASMLKIALGAQSALAADPALVLTGLNHLLCGKFEEHFVTASYLFVDAEKQIFRYAGAGHPPLVFGSVDADKQEAFREIESNGLLLGVSEEATYSALERPFRPGDRCILYTDGVLEAKNAAQEEFGSARLLRFLETQSNLAAIPVLAAFLTELARWSRRTDGGTQEDDVTLIAVDFERVPFSR